MKSGLLPNSRTLGLLGLVGASATFALGKKDGNQQQQ